MSLDFFKRFLRVNNAYGPLQYIQEVEKLKALDHTKAQRTKVHAIVDRFFLRSDSSIFFFSFYLVFFFVCRGIILF